MMRSARTLARTLVRSLVAVALLLAVTGCPSITDALSTTSSKQTYPAIWINASWSGGRTGSPLESKSVVPNNVVGSYCPPSSLDLENHNAKYYASGGDVGLTIITSCTALIPEVAVCQSAGSGGGAAARFGICGTDPRLTSQGNLLIEPGIGRQTYGDTPLNLDINVLYCASGSHMNFGQVAGKAPTDCVVD